MVCPHCKQDAIANQVGFTWWGGFVGASLINHVQCSACGGRFNGKSGQPNTTAITIYMVVTSLLAIGLVIAMMKM